MDGCENAAGAPCDRVKLSLQGMITDNEVFAVLLVWSRKVRSLIQMLYNWRHLELWLYKCDYEAGLIALPSTSRRLSVTKQSVDHLNQEAKKK